eukprot:gb/GECH01014413.1/.p1 GENE.gb/GECH01014413.1/~~gb/GECH01014413.1/.p1  ORF type:complete len:573 (+),score=128.80 gb/GECH01014413.1/:1-1719(+)
MGYSLPLYRQCMRRDDTKSNTSSDNENSINNAPRFHTTNSNYDKMDMNTTQDMKETPPTPFYNHPLMRNQDKSHQPHGSAPLYNTYPDNTNPSSSSSLPPLLPSNAQHRSLSPVSTSHPIHYKISDLDSTYDKHDPHHYRHQHRRREYHPFKSDKKISPQKLDIQHGYSNISNNVGDHNSDSNHDNNSNHDMNIINHETLNTHHDQQLSANTPTDYGSSSLSSSSTSRKSLASSSTAACRSSEKYNHHSYPHQSKKQTSSLKTNGGNLDSNTDNDESFTGFRLFGSMVPPAKTEKSAGSSSIFRDENTSIDGNEDEENHGELSLEENDRYHHDPAWSSWSWGPEEPNTTTTTTTTTTMTDTQTGISTVTTTTTTTTRYSTYSNPETTVSPLSSVSVAAEYEWGEEHPINHLEALNPNPALPFSLQENEELEPEEQEEPSGDRPFAGREESLLNNEHDPLLLEYPNNDTGRPDYNDIGYNRNQDNNNHDASLSSTAMSFDGDSASRASHGPEQERTTSSEMHSMDHLCSETSTTNNSVDDADDDTDSIIPSVQTLFDVADHGVIPRVFSIEDM